MTAAKEKHIVSVYSTEHGRMCPACSQPVSNCTCRQKKTVSSSGNVRVGLAAKGRRGKTVTLITGISLDHAGLSKLAKQLKQKCGTGGTVKDGVIEIQGDHRDLLVAELISQGYTVKRTGKK
jgi:translation initiation factor 1